MTRQRRYRLGESEDRLADQDVDDALSATAAERMEALASLLDAAFAL